MRLIAKAAGARTVERCLQHRISDMRIAAAQPVGHCRFAAPRTCASHAHANHGDPQSWLCQRPEYMKFRCSYYEMRGETSAQRPCGSKTGILHG